MPQHGNLPFGDIFQVGTPYIDRATQQLQNEERQKQLDQRKQLDVLDNEFSKEMANIKKADIPDVIKSYGDYKQSYINLLKRGNRATPQDQYDVLEKRAKVAQVVKGSVEDKEYLKTHSTAITHDNKGLYAPEATRVVQKYLNTPTSQRKIDDDEKELMNQYTVPDIDKELKNAWGVEKPLRIPTGKTSTVDPMKDVVEYYNKGNNPKEAYDNLFTSLVSSKNVRERDNFSNIVDHQYDDAGKEDLQNKYFAKIKDPKYISIYGETAPFPQSAMQTKLGKAVATKIMEHVVNDELKPTTKEEVNIERQTKDRQKFAKEQQDRAIAAGYSRQARSFYHSDNKNEHDQEETNNWIDGLINDSVSQSTTPATKTAKGNTIKEVTLIPTAAKAFDRNGNVPETFRIVIGDNGTRVFTPIYKKYDFVNKKFTDEIDEKLSTPMSENEFKTTMGYKLLSKKQQSDYNSKNFNKTNSRTTPTPSSLNASERRKK